MRETIDKLIFANFAFTTHISQHDNRGVMTLQCNELCIPYT